MLLWLVSIRQNHPFSCKRTNTSRFHPYLGGYVTTFILQNEIFFIFIIRKIIDPNKTRSDAVEQDQRQSHPDEQAHVSAKSGKNWCLRVTKFKHSPGFSIVVSPMGDHRRQLSQPPQLSLKAWNHPPRTENDITSGFRHPVCCKHTGFHYVRVS